MDEDVRQSDRQDATTKGHNKSEWVQPLDESQKIIACYVTREPGEIGLL
jgi:hypothetical protein